MSTESARLDELMGQLRQMSPADRKAILARLPVDQRYILEQALYAGRKIGSDDQPQSPARRHRMFSPALARMLDDIDKGEPPIGGSGATLTAATCEALGQSAQKLREAADKTKTEPEESLWEGISRFFFPDRAR